MKSNCHWPKHLQSLMPNLRRGYCQLSIPRIKIAFIYIMLTKYQPDFVACRVEGRRTNPNNCVGFVPRMELMTKLPPHHFRHIIN